jgi:hypothetical protein
MEDKFRVFVKETGYSIVLFDTTCKILGKSFDNYTEEELMYFYSYFYDLGICKSFLTMRRKHFERGL